VLLLLLPLLSAMTAIAAMRRASKLSTRLYQNANASMRVYALQAADGWDMVSKAV
jgi:hypothetical protein